MPPRIALAALAATALVPPAAVSAAPAAVTIGLSGHVPTLCRAEVRQNGAVSGAMALRGTLEEFCNAADGYEIYAEHSPELAGAVLVVDGVAMALSAEGPTRVSHSDHADIATRSLELRLPNGRTVAGGTLSFRVVAL